LKIDTWLILPVVICLSQRLSHACLSISNLYGETANGFSMGHSREKYLAGPRFRDIVKMWGPIPGPAAGLRMPGPTTTRQMAGASPAKI
ncbi:hypothetical protein BDR22DRAFT_816241, partial [Usnea florida]